MVDYVGDTSLETADIVIIVVYFVIVMAFGLISSLKNRGSVGGYFLAGRSMHWVLVGASLFASNIGSGHFIGLAGSGASSGIGIAVFELNAIFILLLLGWLFVPVYISSGVFTMPEYMRLRFGGQRIRVYLAVLALMLSIFTKISADLYAGAIFIEEAVGWDIYASIIFLLAIAALFTIMGGLTAVMWTDFIQTIIMIIGAIYLMIISFVKVGSYEQLEYKYMRAVSNETKYHVLHPSDNYSYLDCGFPPDDSFHLFRSHRDGSLPWPGVIFGLTISSVWYWCTDQVIVQRALASKNLTYAKSGCITAGYLKFLPMWIIVFPGMISRILFPDTIACATPDACMRECGSENGCTNVAFPRLVLRLMPVGARGLMMAVMMSALMSSLTSIFNSSSTIFTLDIWIRIRKQAKETELMIVGRIFVLIMVAIGIAWIPIVDNFAELFHYIQSVTSYLAPPIAAVYVLAILWKRINEHGAFWSLVIGLLVGLTRFIWESVYPIVACGEPDPKPPIIADVHYLHFGMILYALVTIIAVVISLFTKPMEEKYLHRLLFWNRHSTEPREILPDQLEEEEELRRKAELKGEDNPAADVPQSEGQDDEEPEPEEKTPCWKKTGQWICGIEKHPEVSEEEKARLLKKHLSLEEKPFWRKVCNINAIVLMTLAIFFWGFFA